MARRKPRRPRNPPVAPLTLAAQKSDFTAEGAPPSGTVAGSPLVSSAAPGSSSPATEALPSPSGGIGSTINTTTAGGKARPGPVTG